MPSIPRTILEQIQNPTPDIHKFCAVISGKSKPEKVYLAELFADQEIMQWITEDILKKKWVSLPGDMYDVAVGTPVAFCVPSVSTASTSGDESTLKQPVFCLGNG